MSSSKYNFTAPALMLLFGLFGLCGGAFEGKRVRDNPEPTVLPCEPGALDGLERGVWVRIEGCVIDYEGAVEEVDGSRQRMLFGIYESVRADEPSAMLMVEDDAVFDLLGESRRGDAQPQAVFERIDEELGVDALEGMTRASLDAKWKRFLPDLRDDIVTVEYGQRPDPAGALFGILVGIVLLGLSGVYWRKAKRLQAEERRAWTHARR